MKNRRYQFLAIMGFTLASFLMLQYGRLKRNDFELIIEKQNYHPIKYLDLDPNVNSSLPRGTTIYHVTREFGKSAKTNLGYHVTALANAQSADDSLLINIVTPYYSFLRHVYKSSPYCRLSIRIRDEHEKWQSVEFRVYRFWFNNTENQTFNSNKSNLIRVFMIDHASKVHPYNLAFKSRSISSTKGLSSELEDLYFCKAAAELITYLNTMIETPLFAKINARDVGVVHIHGSINALAVDLIKELHKDNKPQKTHPPIIYTLHDHYDEQLYSVHYESLNRFVSAEKFRVNNPNYFHQNRLFTSSLGIDGSQAATFVSEEGAQYIVEKTPNFYMKELIMPSILQKAKNGRWVGVNKDLDTTILNPFSNAVLLESNSNYPNNIDSFDVDLFYAEVAESTGSQPLIHTAKTNAKNYLIREGILKSEDLKKSLLLFTGSFRYPEGSQFFDRVAEILKDHNAKLMIVMPRYDFTRGEDESGEDIEKLAEKYPNEMLIFNDEQISMDWGILFRAAADIEFLLSLKEHYEMANMAEGSFFGNIVIGGVTKEFGDFFSNKGLKNDHTNFLFDFYPHDLESTIRSLEPKLKLAISYLRSTDMDFRKRELFLRGFIKGALKLSQESKGREAEKYKRIYKMASNETRKRLWRIEESEAEW
ncbi:3339_t:CDS:2 [Acaulospora morrowiae]|uniref:3339_t:CDS:1 n=1 Tax=Acaulospora morrowiae TaxID=94023 RepID=A0A9N9GLS0_9GLOM|nr:3339_t:CDS:2 [Acaulospora morrowiae]